MGNKNLNSLITACRSIDDLHKLIDKKLIAALSAQPGDTDTSTMNTLIRKLTALVDKQNIDEAISLLSLADDNINMPNCIIKHLNEHSFNHINDLWDVIFLFQRVSKLNSNISNAKKFLHVLMHQFEGSTIGHLVAPYSYMFRELVYTINNLLRDGVKPIDIFALLSLQNTTGKTIEHIFIEHYDQGIGDLYFSMLHKITCHNSSVNKLVELWSIQSHAEQLTTGMLLIAETNKSLLDKYLNTYEKLFNYDVDLTKILAMLNQSATSGNHLFGIIARSQNQELLTRFISLISLLSKKGVNTNALLNLLVGPNSYGTNALYFILKNYDTACCLATFDLMKHLITAGADPKAALTGLRLDLTAKPGHVEAFHLGHTIGLTPETYNRDSRRIAVAYSAFLLFLHQAGVDAASIQSLLEMRIRVSQNKRKSKKTYSDMMLSIHARNAGTILYPLASEGLLPKAKHRPKLRDAINYHVATLSEDEKNIAMTKFEESSNRLRQLYSKKNQRILFFNAAKLNESEDNLLLRNPLKIN